MITQRTGKFTVAQAKELGESSSPIINFLYRLTDKADTDKIAAVIHASITGGHPHWLTSSMSVKGLGEPLVRVREYESSPGLWVFDDAQSKITFLIWSDGYKVKPWKGTSIEVLATGAQLAMLADAFQRLDARLRLKYADYLQSLPQEYLAPTSKPTRARP